MAEMTQDLQAVKDGLANGMRVRVTSRDLDAVRVMAVEGDTLKLLDGPVKFGRTKDAPVDEWMAFEIYRPLR